MVISMSTVLFSQKWQLMHLVHHGKYCAHTCIPKAWLKDLTYITGSVKFQNNYDGKIQLCWTGCLNEMFVLYREHTHHSLFFFFFFPFLMLYKEVRELRQFRSDIRLWWRWYKAVDSILANSQRTMHKGIGSTWSWSQLPSWTACRVFATLILLNVIVSAFLSLIHVNPFTRKQLQ